MAASHAACRLWNPAPWAACFLWLGYTGLAWAGDDVPDPSTSPSLSPNQPIGLDANRSPSGQLDTTVLIPREHEKAESKVGSTTLPLGTARDVPWYRSPWISLALVLGSIGVLAWILRRTRSFQSQPRSPLALLTKIALSPRQNLAVVRLGHRLVLVGATDHGISLIAEITDAEEVALIQSQSKAPVSGRRFNESLSEAEARLKSAQRESRSERPAAASEAVQATEAVQSLIDSLRSRRFSPGDKRERVS